MKIEVEVHDRMDKDFSVSIGYNLFMRVDYDDVDHDSVDADLKKMVSILEKYWDDPEFSQTEKEKEIVQWFKDEFCEIAEEYGNCEEIYSAVASKVDNGLTIDFTVDMGRQGAEKGEVIIKNNIIHVSMPEILEGGDIEHRLRQALKKKFISKIPELKILPVPYYSLYDPHDECIDREVSRVQLLDFIDQIVEANIDDYYFFFEDEKYTIDANGSINPPILL